MITRIHQRPFVWLTLTLLLGAAVPAGAQEGRSLQSTYSAGEVRLNLAEALDFESAVYGHELRPNASSAIGVAQQARLSELDPAALREAWSALQQTEQAEAEAAPKKRGVGRWLKKHWYVPVLVAGAIGALASSGGDDDSSGEDD